MGNAFSIFDSDIDAFAEKYAYPALCAVVDEMRAADAHQVAADAIRAHALGVLIEDSENGCT